MFIRTAINALIICLAWPPHKLHCMQAHNNSEQIFHNFKIYVLNTSTKTRQDVYNALARDIIDEELFLGPDKTSCSKILTTQCITEEKTLWECSLSAEKALIKCLACNLILKRWSWTKHTYSERHIHQVQLTKKKSDFIII